MLSLVIGQSGCPPYETGGTSEGSRSDVRAFRNFEPRTSRFGSRLWRASRFLRSSRDAVRGCHSSKRPPGPQRNHRFRHRRSVNPHDRVAPCVDE